MSDEECEVSQTCPSLRGESADATDHQRQQAGHSSGPDSVGSAAGFSGTARCQMDHNQTNTSCESVAPAPPTATNRLGGAAAAQRQYFIRHSMNNSIRTRRSHLRRSSARRRSGRQQRQVRFQPVAQAIDISGHEQASSGQLQPASGPDQGDQQTRPLGEASDNSKLAGKSRQLARMQQQINKLSRKSRAQLSTSAKPLTRKLHSHMSQLNLVKLKLKSLNQFAAQLRHQTGHQFAAASRDEIESAAGTSRRPLGSALASKGMKLLHLPQQLQRGPLKSTGCLSAVSGAPLQQSFHIRHSAATARHKITLLNVRGANVGARQQRPQFSAHFEHADLPGQAQWAEQEADADGWGSDFDDTAQESQDDLSTAGDKNGYLLEIGKSSCDTRRVHDVIQDQGLSGRFKRLDLSSAQFHEQAGPSRQPQESRQPAALAAAQSSASAQRERLAHIRANLTMDRADCHVDVDEVLAMANVHEYDEDEEAAEQASLEARQGYRQVRDKLKLILDRRLANTAGDSAASNNAQPEQAAQTGHRQGRQEERQEEEPAHEVEPVAVQCDKKQAAAGGQHASDRFECQSNCSEASSVSSGGLDSNHSGSQDSGHSTQHSGYSSSAALLRRADHGGACRRHRHRSAQRDSPSSLESGAESAPASEPPLSSPGASSNRDTSPSMNRLLDSGASSCSDEPHRATAAGPQRPAAQATEVSPGGAPDPQELERRQRFQQNRLLINSKLESLFKSRSGPALPVTRAEQPASQQASPSKSIQSCPTPSSAIQLARAKLSPSSCSSSALDGNASRQPAGPLEAAIRMRLLEQQRQMSLKLKQKPRRRTAKRALNLISAHSPVSHSSGSLCAASMDERCDSGLAAASCIPRAADEHQSSYPSPGEARAASEQPSVDEGRFARLNQAAGGTRDSLSKQLSMVCLRQLQQAPAGEQSPQTSGHSLASSSSSQQLSQARGGVLSLRQLVKEVIDDCERPAKMSTLTREILNRSDSLSSEGLAAAIETGAGGREQASQRLTSSPLGSASLCARSSPNLSPNLSRISSGPEQESGRTCQRLPLAPQIKPIGIHANSTHHFETPLRFGPAERPSEAVTPLPQRTYYLPVAGTPTNEYSITSSLGTIDGLEFDPSLSATSDISQHQLGQQQAQAASPALHSVLKQPGSKPGRVGAYWKSLRQFSRFKIPKVNMAYLDNTSNFFADDDN